MKTVLVVTYLPERSIDRIILAQRVEKTNARF